MKRFARHALISLAVVLLIALLLNSYDIYVQHRGVAPDGDELVLFSTIYLVIPLLLALASILFSLPFLFFKTTRRVAVIVLLSGITYLIGAKVCFRIGSHIRMQAFQRLAERSDSLIQAVESYNSTHGHYPESLINLVPECIPAIPNTGMGAYPNYEYRSGTNTWHENPYVLYVNTPRGGINWDMFLYFPKQNYPEKGFCGALERVGTWAYVHE